MLLVTFSFNFCFGYGQFLKEFIEGGVNKQLGEGKKSPEINPMLPVY